LQVRYSVTVPGLQDDTFENVLHFINIAPALAGETLTDTQKTAIESAWQTFWNAIKSKCSADVGLQEFRWYGISLADPIGGPPNRITTLTRNTGSSSLFGPLQVAETITLRTALRKHWGRLYLPVCPSAFGHGTFASGDVDLIANSFRTFIASCVTAQTTPVVYSPSRQSVLSISQVEADNLPDIVRRRRPKNSTYKKIITT
jgi:hypothetical protein